MTNERDILKTLLLKEELEVLDALKNKLLSEEQFTQEVSDVLARAIRRSNLENDQVTKALAIPIRKGVIRAFTTSKQSIIDALLPIMGQLIRKTVSNNMKQFVTDINRAIEQRFSLKSFKWRWQAQKAGITYPEMLFKKTIRYQVIELFLISRENGLLIEHVGTEESAKDNNAISAMLTVIQDFIRDSFDEDDASLENVTIKNVEYIFASGPKAYIVSVVKGMPTERLNEKIQELIENVHADFSDTLNKEETYRNNLELSDYLSGHLITKNKGLETNSINWAPWIIVAALLISGLGYLAFQGYQNTKQRNNLIIEAENTQGFFLQSVEKTSEGFQIKGLADPLANIKSLQGKNINIQTKPYISLDSSIVKLRISKVIAPYKTINVELNNYQATVSGIVSKQDHDKVLLLINNVIGVEQIDNQLKIDIRKEVVDLLNNYKKENKNFDYQYEDHTIILLGSVTYDLLQDLKSQIKKTFPKSVVIIDKGLIIIDSTDILITEINETIINIPKLKTRGEKLKLIKIDKSLQLILQRGSRIGLTIIGESDCVGTSSDKYSWQRAEKIKQKLEGENLEKLVISTKVKTCNNYKNNENNSLLNVSFKVKQI